MKITFEIDDDQADWLEGIFEMSPAEIAELLLSHHIAERGGPVPERFADKVDAGRFSYCAQAALEDYGDINDFIDQYDAYIRHRCSECDDLPSGEWCESCELRAMMLSERVKKIARTREAVRRAFE